MDFSNPLYARVTPLTLAIVRFSVEEEAGVAMLDHTSWCVRSWDTKLGTVSEVLLGLVEGYDRKFDAGDLMLVT